MTENQDYAARDLVKLWLSEFMNILHVKSRGSGSHKRAVSEALGKLKGRFYHN
jgi:hypothetical protein